MSLAYPNSVVSLRSVIVSVYPQFQCYVNHCFDHYMSMIPDELTNWLILERNKATHVTQWHKQAFQKCGNSKTSEDDKSCAVVKELMHKIGNVILDAKLPFSKSLSNY